jgi:predicted transcriptional regulator
MKLAGRVKDFMSKDFPIIRAEEPICNLVGKIHGFRVVKSGKEIVGIVTEMDALRKIRKSDKPADLLVQDCMSPCKVTGVETCFQIGEDRPADEALKVLTTGDISQLLVFNSKKQIVGVLSVSSLLKGIKECKLI